MQNKFFSSKLNTILLLVIIVLLAIGLWMLGSKKVEKNNSEINNQITIKESTNVVDPTNTDMMIFTSSKLGIQFTYPKIISSTGGSNNITISNPISVVEDGNKLTVSAGIFGSYYALIYHKDTNETIEQSIMRQLVKKEYQNNPCYVKDFGYVNYYENQYYEVTFPGDLGDAGGWEKEGADNAKKCGQEVQLRQIVGDPINGGFFVATRGAQEPSFGISTSGDWWPKGIKFIK